MEKTFDEIFSEIKFLLKKYTDESRASIQPFHYDVYKEINSNSKFDPTNRIIRESLIEHVGTLPILAVFFHGYVAESINLGRVLEMLAVHDIGEVTIGDEIVFTKNDADEHVEMEEALKLLNVKHHSAYKEFKEQKTSEAKFAKSIDKISPDIYDLIINKEITIARLKYFAGMEADEIVDTIEKFKSPYMQWNNFFREFHAELINKLRLKFE